MRFWRRRTTTDPKPTWLTQEVNVCKTLAHAIREGDPFMVPHGYRLDTTRGRPVIVRPSGYRYPVALPGPEHPTPAELRDQHRPNSFDVLPSGEIRQTA